MVDGKSMRDGQFGDPALKDNNEQAAQNLLRDAQSGEKGAGLPADIPMKAISDEIARQQGYKFAVKSEVEAETSWNRALPKGEKSLTAEKLKERLQDPKLDSRSRGFLQFCDDNFDKISGIAGKRGEISLADVTTIGRMNEIDTVRMEAGVKFLKQNFFQVSGLDDKVNAQRVERLLFDHSFSLYPKETQERLNDLVSIVKSADNRIENFDPTGKRVKSGLTSSEAEGLDPAALSDNLRIQALQKGMFGGKVQKLDSKQIAPEAKTQFEAAQKRYRELQEKGLDKFLAGLEKQ